jgi:hypothetical protein
MTAGFSQEEESKREQSGSNNAFLTSSPNHTPSFLQYPFSYAGEPCAPKSTDMKRYESLWGSILKAAYHIVHVLSSSALLRYPKIYPIIISA